MNGTEPNLYDYHIARAAREYIKELKKPLSKDIHIDLEARLEKLRWLILAEENSWNPNIYEERNKSV